VLIVALGYGVVKPTLGTTWYKVFFLSVGYCIFSGALSITELVSRSAVLSASSVFLLVFPVAILDTFFYWWIFLSLLRTIQQLSLRRQVIKLAMYKRFFLTLIASGLVTALVILIQLFVSVSVSSDETWSWWWIWNGFWHLLYFLILAVIALLWRPTTNNTRYACAEMSDYPGSGSGGTGVDEEEIRLQPLSVLIPDSVTQRKKTGSSSALNALDSPGAGDDDDDNVVAFNAASYYDTNETTAANNNNGISPASPRRQQHGTNAAAAASPTQRNILEVPISFSIDDDDDDSNELLSTNNNNDEDPTHRLMRNKMA